MEMKRHPVPERSQVGLTRIFSRRENPLLRIAILTICVSALETTGFSSSLPPNSIGNGNTTLIHFRHHRDVFTLDSRDTTSYYHQGPQRPFEFDGTETYDPVEAYHKMRRLYLTSTSNVRGPSSYPTSYTNGHGQGNGRTRHQHQGHTLPNGHSHKPNYETYGEKSESVNTPNESNGVERGGSQRCYVCLPPNKNSREAKDILTMFGRNAKIADCADFTRQNAFLYEFTCPPAFGGCILRIHGLNVSRACSKYRLNDCKKANSVEFCYCTDPLCNDIKPTPKPLSSETEDDDEDGLGSGEETEKALSGSTKPNSSEPPISDTDSEDIIKALANFNDGESGDQTPSTDLNLVSSSEREGRLSIFLILLFPSLLLILLPNFMGISATANANSITITGSNIGS